MVNSISMADYVVILAEGSKWAYEAIDRFLDTLVYAKQNVNPKLEVSGNLRTLNDAWRSDSGELTLCVNDFFNPRV